MGVMIAIFAMSYVVGRITLIENITYKSNDATLRFTTENKVFFFVMMLIKIFIAFKLASIFVPDESLRNLDMELDFTSSNIIPEISRAIYQYETRLLISMIGVICGNVVGIFKLKN